MQKNDTEVTKATGEAGEKVVQDENAQELMPQKTADSSETLWIGGVKNLIEWSIRDKKIIKVYEGVMTENIHDLKTTSDKKH